MWLGSRQRCPQCAETVRKQARVCRYCGHEFTPPTPAPEPVAVSAPVPAPTPAVAPSPPLPPPPPGRKPALGDPAYREMLRAPPGTPKEPLAGETRKRGWRQPLRWVLVVELVLVGAAGVGLAAAPEGTEAQPGQFVGGFAAGIVWWLIVAQVVRAVQSPRGGDRGLWYQMTSFPVLIGVTVFLFAGAAGQSVRQAEEDSTAPASSSSAASDGSDKTETRRDEFVSWYGELVPVITARARLRADLNRGIKGADQGDFSKFRTAVRQCTAQAQKIAGAAGAMSEVNADPRLDQATRMVRRSSDLTSEGCDQYAAGIDPIVVKTVDRGDALLKRSDRVWRQSLKAANTVYQDLGGAAALNGRIDINGDKAKAQRIAAG